MKIYQLKNVLFVAGGQMCSGINDETRGIQLSYMNDNSNGWVQLAYYSDTIYYAVSMPLCN